MSAEIDLEALLDLARKEVALSRSAKNNIGDDVAQQAIIELLDAHLLANHPNPEALVVQAVRWRGIDAQRRWNRDDHQPELGSIGGDRVLIPGSWNPSPSLRVANATAMKDAFITLSVVDRLILWRHDVEGVTFDEIAAEIGLALGTVRNRAAAARKRLRSLLEG